MSLIMPTIVIPFPSTKVIVIAGSTALAGITGGILSTALQQEQAPVAKAEPAALQRWEDIETDAAKKQDRLDAPKPPVASTDPKPISTVAVTPDDNADAEAKPKVRRVKSVERDVERESNVCTRHGLRKVWTERRHWRAWRCRK